MKINVHNQQNESITPYLKTLKKIFKSIHLKKSFEIIFIDDEYMHKLNNTYRGIDKTTDVLSFPNDDEKSKSLGDVFISLPMAKKQAETLKHSVLREIGFLAVHGYLHLVGFDHQTELEEEVMTAEQNRILKLAKLERNNNDES
jgi:probable rRNA maturation factor